MTCRGVRGATTVTTNSRQEILQETRRLLALMIRLNGMTPESIGSAFFTTTRDINAEFPALAARQLGWWDVALMCGHEMEVPGSLPRCIRIMVHWNTDTPQNEIRHIYLGEAVKLRPDKASLPPLDEDELEAWIETQVSTWERISGRTR
jgi:chorismate mutase